MCLCVSAMHCIIDSDDLHKFLLAVTPTSGGFCFCIACAIIKTAVQVLCFPVFSLESFVISLVTRGYGSDHFFKGGSIPPTGV